MRYVVGVVSSLLLLSGCESFNRVAITSLSNIEVPARVDPQLSISTDSACVLVGAGKASCWGRNAEAQLGGAPTSVRSAPLSTAFDVGFHADGMVAFDSHTCLWRTGSSDLKCFGRADLAIMNSIVTYITGNFYWGDTANEMGPSLPFADLKATTPIARMFGYGTSWCVQYTDGNIRCWGSNIDGELGVGDKTDHYSLVPPYANVDLGPSEVVEKAAIQSRHGCALLVGGKIKCWGTNLVTLGNGSTFTAGALGTGDTVSHGDGTGAMGAALLPVDLGTGRTALDVQTGLLFTCAILDDKSVKCWGHNSSGQLGQGDIAYRGSTSATIGDNLPAVDLGTGEKAVQLALGTSHACALLESGKVKCWGGNNSGQLGLGDTSARGDAAGEMGDALPAVDLGTTLVPKQIRAAGDFTCVMFEGPKVKCWGANGYGQLGVGDQLNRGDLPGTMGTALPYVNLPEL